MIRATRLALFCVLVFGLAIAAGCASSGSSAGGPDPATAMPANAGVYFEGVVRPDGDARDDALAAAGKIMGGGSTPEQKLEDLFNKNAKDAAEKQLNWDRDISPWLGERAGGWVSTTTSQGAESGYTFAIAVKDKDKAAEFLKRAVSGGKKGSYKGVDYTVDQDGNAQALVGDFVLVGTVPEFKKSVDAEKGDSLADADRYKNAVKKLDENRLGTFYVDPKPVIDAALRADPSQRQDFQQFTRIFPIDKLEPITGELRANAERMKLDTHITGSGAETLTRFGLLTGAGSTKLIGELPGESWAAYGVPNLGNALATVLDRFGGALGGAAIAGQVQQSTGLDLRNDVFDLIGDVALFARGSTMADLDGGLVIAVKDDSRATEVFGKLIALIRSQGGVDPKPVQVAGADQAFSIVNPSTTKPFVVARGKGKLVVSYGADAASAAFQPKTQLKDTELFAQGKAALDNKYDPAFLFSMDGILKLVDGLGGGTDPDFQQVRPYLARLSAIASGGAASGKSFDATVGVGLR